MAKRKIFISESTLRQLYLEETLSSPQIARRYSCTPTTVRRILRKFNVPIRDGSKAAQLRKVNRNIKILRDELEDLYLNQRFSAHKIALLFDCNAESIRKRLHKYKIPIRSAVETSTIHKKFDFDGNKEQKSYLIGFRLGDLYVERQRKNGRTICVKCSSTKDEQVKLIQRLFSPYGKVWVSDIDIRKARKIYCYLNMSFDFLLKKEDNIPHWIRRNKKYFFAFLAGYIDAEGCFSHGKGCSRLNIQSYDKNILHQTYIGLNKYKIRCAEIKLTRPKGYNLDGQGERKGDTWNLGIYRRKELSKLFSSIRPYLKHSKRCNDMESAYKYLLELEKKYISRIEKVVQ